MVSYTKSWLNFLGGLLFTGLGIITFASHIGSPFGFIPSFLSFLYNTLLIKVCLIVSGLMLFASSFSLTRRSIGGTLKPIIIGLLLAVIGAFPLLMDYKLLSFLPFKLNFTIPNAVLSGLLTAYGVYLFYMAYKVYQRNRFLPQSRI
jgi:hypothetical protein